MRINNIAVPGSFVEIVQVTNLDGSALAPDNWRRGYAGVVTLLIFAGGIRRLTPFFQYKIQMKEGKVVHLNLDWDGNASTGPGWPVEVEPGIYDFRTNTSIYRFRLLSEAEEQTVRTAVQKAIDGQQALLHQILKAPAGPES